MSILNKHPDVDRLLDEFKLPEKLIFGQLMAPVMFEADYTNEQWGPLNMVPYGPLSLDPSTKVFHYAQEIFEGLKAYKRKDRRPTLFRPDQNFNRFNVSAKRMAMPEVPENYFMTAVKAMTHYCSEFIPTNSGESLYIRPFMFATEANVGIRPSKEYKFLVIASPSGAYFSSGSVKVLIQREYVRAVRGGTGNVKAGGNYAGSLLSSEEAIKKGFQQSLWLDAIERKYVEEMSGMNFCAIIKGKLVTPKLTETILPGITRDSLLTLAPSIGIDVSEESIEIDELIDLVKKGDCTEAFACGTAAIVTPINSFNENDGKVYELKEPNGKMSMQLKESLLALQETGVGDQWGWSQTIEAPE